MSDAVIDKERGVVSGGRAITRGRGGAFSAKSPLIFYEARDTPAVSPIAPEVLQGFYARLRDFSKDWYRPEWMAVW
jgi:hypothetical protein